MIISIIGDCDTRPVLYTLMKVCQSLGDVLVVTSNNRLLRLSDTRDSFGHYQNTMIGYTVEGIDNFWEECVYDVSDFSYVIIDNMITASADLVLYCQGLLESEEEKDNLEYIDDYIPINMFAKGILSANTIFMMEEFESYKDMCPIGQKLADLVCGAISSSFGMSKESLVKLATVPTSTHPKVLPKTKKPKAGFGRRG